MIIPKDFVLKFNSDGNVCKTINTKDRINLKMNEQIYEEAQDVLLHISVNVQEICDTQVVDCFWKHFIAKFLDEGVISNGVVDCKCLSRIRDAYLTYFDVIWAIYGKEGT